MFKELVRFGHPTGKSRRRRVTEGMGNMVKSLSGEALVGLATAIVVVDMKRQDVAAFIEREGLGGAVRVLGSRLGETALTSAINSAASLREGVLLSLSGIEPSGLSRDKQSK